ncbi:MAG: hypothetical protein KDC80_00595 [Saprospiraceae bacterium]|nr:hypothetical protein [Saprospiraceae bacterium]
MKSVTSHSSPIYLSLVLYSLFFMIASIAELSGQDLSGTEAQQLAKQAAKEAGFTKIYFTSKILSGQLRDAQGLNIYSGLPDQGRTGVLMLVGAAADGTDLSDSYVQNNENQELKLIDRATRDAQITNIENQNRTTPIVAFFPKADIERLTNQTGVTGLHFMPARVTGSDGSEILVLNVAAASAPAVTIESTALRSPCPPECPPR